jgi:hypothetical protein
MYFAYCTTEPVYPDTDIVIIDFPLLDNDAIEETAFDTDTLMCKLNSDCTAAMKDFTGYLFHDEEGHQEVDLYGKNGELIAHNGHPLINYEETKLLNKIFNRYI